MSQLFAEFGVPAGGPPQAGETLQAFREVARHPNATAAALLVCLADRQARPLAARHSALPPSAIAELIDDENWQVAGAAAANPALPYAVMQGLVP